MLPAPVWSTDLPGLAPPRRGKVRDVYDLGDRLLIVACDRISAYDHVLRPGIAGKGRILNQLTNFWFDELGDRVPHHLIATDPEDFSVDLSSRDRELLRGRAVEVRKAEVVPFECVARGWLAGSGFREYSASGTVCGLELPSGLVRASRLPEPIFTPATKAESGHDENVGFDVMAEGVGAKRAAELRDLTLDLYAFALARAEKAGLLLADTKLEFGLVEGRPMLVDEAFTPDSSRYWEASAWTPGEEPASFDKQFVRNWLDESGWDHESPPPELPEEVVRGTLERYVEAFRRLTGREPDLG